MHFSEIIKIHYGKKTHTMLCILLLFLNYCCLIISEKMRGFPQFSFRIAIALAKISFSCIVINRAKILVVFLKILTSVLVGNVLNWFISGSALDPNGILTAEYFSRVLGQYH